MQAPRDEADALNGRMKSRGATARDIKRGAELLGELKRVLDLDKLADLAETLARVAPNDGMIRSLYAQALIDTGHATAALDVLHAALGRPGLTTKARAEIYGLVGRANKQIFMDAADRSATSVRAALTRAIAAYRVPYDYFTPTSKGTSGSPVFDETWKVVALHHLGARYAPRASELGLPHLNGQPGLYSANEGIWIGSIRQDVSRQLASGKL